MVTSTILKGIDIAMIHGPSNYILDSTSNGQSAGCEHLRRAVAYTKPQPHCFGYVHGGHGAQPIEFEFHSKCAIKRNSDGDELENIAIYIYIIVNL
ncbi:hypothetical protein CC78DRAFT_527870 [Lojkania enalia]|uniref:Uncharacterized protein n=1 Tax=Lojkania enalia TaxID=147567 RepID=A0A9P4TS07_9PLEO|nr:hypothetical protein CC78DRAFT_527870 [Didymosphaeria enalia]